MQKSLIALALSLVLVSFVAMNLRSNETSLRVNAEKPATVPYVDINRYFGLWYEQSHIPVYFEKGCVKTTANYSLNPDGKTIRVNNTCIRNGKASGGIAKAIV